MASPCKHWGGHGQATARALDQRHLDQAGLDQRCSVGQRGGHLTGQGVPGGDIAWCGWPDGLCLPQCGIKKPCVIAALTRTATSGDLRADHVVTRPALATNSRHKAESPEPAHGVAHRANTGHAKLPADVGQRQPHIASIHFLVRCQQQQYQGVTGNQLALFNQGAQVQQALPAEPDPALVGRLKRDVLSQRQRQFFQ